MKILSSTAIRIIDAKTIQYDNITSDELMEKAATAFFNHFIQQHRNLKNNIVLFCGSGNNGGDGLVVARLLYEAGYNVEAYLIKVGEAISNDCALNLDRANRVGLNVATITSQDRKSVV